MKPKRTGKWIVVLFLVLSGCVMHPKPDISPPPASMQPRKIAIFFDGTFNDPRSGTNVAELFKLVRSTEAAGVFYIEGVGAKGKPIGMAMAWGIGIRVRSAYAYLLEHYQPGDQIYLFGFSRGSYSARILASMLYHAGLPRAATTGISSEELASVVYDAFKGELRSADRIKRVQQILSDHRLPMMQPIDVKFMGLWDTVEALGWPDYEENVDVPNPRYGDQLCNVEQASHAVSLDDNRARIFTPLLLTRTHLLGDCGRESGPVLSRSEIAQRIDAKVQEVYFAGAHADVGGGYEDGAGKLSGVSLNWMVRQARKAGLPTEPAHLKASGPKYPFDQDPLAPSNDPEGSFPYNLVYKRMYRSIDDYADSSMSTTRVVKFHATLKERIETQARGKAEYGGIDDDAQAVLRGIGAFGRFNTCFPQDGGKRRYVQSDACMITIVND